MDNRSGIQKKIERLRRNLIKCCYWYYVKAEPLISDHAFDMLFKELEMLEKTFHGEVRNAVTSDSPTQMIYGDREDQYPMWAKDRELGNLKG